MLDIVFFVWIRTGSYPPDSNEYEKNYSCPRLQTSLLVGECRNFAWLYIIGLLSEFTRFVLHSTNKNAAFLDKNVLKIRILQTCLHENPICSFLRDNCFSRIYSNPGDRNRFSSIRKNYI